MNISGEHTLSFMKMHGLGNDFVVFDMRDTPNQLNKKEIIAIGDRRNGIGYDQLATIENAPNVDARLTFWNSDGSISGACGNATRCIARYLMQESARDSVILETQRGTLYAKDAGNGLTSVNMGHPQLAWHEVPLAKSMDTLHLPIDGDPAATGMGNPHCTFIVEDAEAIDLANFGPTYEHHPLYPERTNVQVASLIGPDHLRMRVWERGVGVTLASGSSSCATAVTATRRGLTGRKVKIDLDGGTLWIDWRDDGVWMTGPTMHVCDGILSAEFLDSAK